MKNPLYILNKFYTRIFYLVVSLTSLVLFGAVGYMYLEGYSFLEGLWFTTISVTTLGYEISPNFSDEAKIFTMFLMLIGISLLLITLSIIASDILQGNYKKAYKLYTMDKKINALDQHVIVCGFGRNGRQAARKLQLYKKDFLVVDVKKLESSHGAFNDVTFVKGNAINEDVLLQSGIERAEALIAALPSDADNLFIVMSAKQLNPNIKIISRASDSNSVSKLKIAGANNVIMPDKVGGDHMASLVVTPDLIEFVDQIKLENSTNINLIEISTLTIAQEYIGKSLDSFRQYCNTNCTIIGYKNKHNQYLMNPDKEELIQENEHIIFFGRSEQIETLKQKLNLN